MWLLKIVPDNTNIRFVRLRWIAFAVTAILTLSSIALLVTRGLNFGVDFVGVDVNGVPTHIPVGGVASMEFGATEADRFIKIRLIRVLNGLQRISWAVVNQPAAVNSDVYSFCCNLTCALELNLYGKTAKNFWQEVNDTILKNILETLTRDPGRRVLVTIDCRRRQWLVKQLAQTPMVDLVHYNEL